MRKEEITYEIDGTMSDGDEKISHFNIKGIKGSFPEKAFECIRKGSLLELFGSMCEGCKYSEQEGWRMPCCKCKRMAEDYFVSWSDESYGRA